MKKHIILSLTLEPFLQLVLHRPCNRFDQGILKDEPAFFKFLTFFHGLKVLPSEISLTLLAIDVTDDVHAWGKSLT